MADVKEVNKEQVIEINDAGSSFTIDRACMKNCTETPDGFSIQLLNGLMILYENTNMPATSRKAVVHALLQYVTVKKITINLRDYIKPVKIVA